MLGLILQIIIGLIGGIAAAFQAAFSGLMGERLGNMESVFVTYVGGGLLILMAMLLTKGSGNLGAWRSVPWYVFLAGPLGLVIISSLSYTVPRLGTATATTLFIAAWLVLSAILDHFGFFGVDARSLGTGRLAGIFILLAGTWLIIR